MIRPSGPIIPGWVKDHPYPRALKKIGGEAPSFRDLEVICVHLDHRRGMNQKALAKKYHLSIQQVRNALGTRIEEITIDKRLFDQYLKLICIEMVHLQREMLVYMTPEEMEKSSLMQLATATGILADKTKQYDAHVEGTRDTSYQPQVTFETVQDLKSTIRERMIRLGMVEESAAWMPTTVREAEVESEEVGEGDEGGTEGGGELGSLPEKVEGGRQGVLEKKDGREPVQLSLFGEEG